MNIKKFNNYFFLYLLLLLFFGIFWLYIKHQVGNDSTISEWLINYQGGFTRRGLVGEICFQIAKHFNLSLRFIIFIFQSFIYISFLILIYRFFKNTPTNLIVIFSIFTPIFLLYPIAEIEVLARKETIIFISFLLFLNVSNFKLSENLSLFYVFFILPIICLIWEPVIFFFPFIASILLIRLANNNTLIALSKIGLSFTPSLIVLVIIATNPLAPENHLIMVNSLKENFGEDCYMACGMLLSRSSIISQFVNNYEDIMLSSLIRYPLIILIGFGPIFLLSFNTKLKLKILFFRNFENLLYPILLMSAPVLILFGMMGDWGRIVNISYTFTILFYFYLLRNNLLEINLKKIEKKILFIKNKKSLIVICFILYAFGWTPQTTLRGDVSSFPGYRIPYKSIKMLSYQIKNN